MFNHFNGGGGGGFDSKDFGGCGASNYGSFDDYSYNSSTLYESSPVVYEPSPPPISAAASSLGMITENPMDMMPIAIALAQSEPPGSSSLFSQIAGWFGFKR